jgi:GNAT superfamily N-acetyltransferase
MTPADVRFAPCHPEDEPARSLIDAMVAEMRELYRLGAEQVGGPLDAAEMAPPGGTYLVALDGDDPCAGGGLRTIAPGVGEVKRMYVAPAWRGRGLARRLLAALEEEAGRLRHHIIRLDTGARQPQARQLYLTSGYVETVNYNGSHHAAFWGEKKL